MVNPKDKSKLPNTELTQIKEYEKKIRSLKEDNDILRNIIAIIPGNVYWKDNEGRFLGCNNNVAGILGLAAPSDIIGKRNRDLFDTRLAFLADQVDKMVGRTPTETYIEEIGLSINNKPAFYLSKKLPLYDNNDNIVGILGVSFDITERKKMEEDLKKAKEKAEKSSQAKSQFLTVVNHELRTPLASIIGLVEFLKQKSLSKIEEKKVIHAIENCTKHLLGLVTDVLEFSRLEAGKYSVRLGVVDIHSLLYEVYDITKPLAKKKQLALQIQLGPNIPKHIMTDHAVLRQILINLVSNGIKFTNQGHVKIKINHLAKLENKQLRLEFSVSDTGLGIPSENLRLIFEPFQQLEDAYTRQSSRSGTGLGLTIVEKLAALIRAQTHVKSSLGKGSTFSIIGEFEVPDEDLANLSGPQSLWIDVLPKKKPKKSRPTNKTIYPELLSKQPKVLLIEDDPIVQYVHNKMLTDLGCNVDAYMHGHEAIEKLDNHDISFVDISLPDISGFDVIKKIREKNKHIPIIALTVYTGKEEKQASVKAGANEFTSKPVSQNHLKKLLLRYFPTEKKFT